MVLTSGPGVAAGRGQEVCFHRSWRVCKDWHYAIPRRAVCTQAHGCATCGLGRLGTPTRSWDASPCSIPFTDQHRGGRSGGRNPASPQRHNGHCRRDPQRETVRELARQGPAESVCGAGRNADTRSNALAAGLFRKTQGGDWRTVCVVCSSNRDDGLEA